MRRLTLGLGFVLAASSLAILGFAIYHAQELPDLGLPGLAALAAIGANVAFIAAFRLKRGWPVAGLRLHLRLVRSTDHSKRSLRGHGGPKAS